MTLAETIYQHSLQLPEPAARQVLTFIEALERSYRLTPPVAATTDDTEAFFAAVAGTLPVQAITPVSISWEQRVLSLAGTLSDDFPDDIDESDLGQESPRESLE